MRGRKRNQTDPGLSREARRLRRGENEIDYENSQMIHYMEVDAYRAVLKAFNAQSDSVSWERVALMTKLRKELNVTDEEHGEMLVKIRQSKESIKELREWWNSSNSSATAAQEFGNVYVRSDVLRIGATDQIIRQVEKLLDGQGILSPVQLEEARLVLLGHERAILEVLDQLAIDEAAGA